MNNNEIISYLTSSSQGKVCVYRALAENTETIVKSIYIAGSVENSVVRVEFEPITLINQGEGWVWQSSAMKLAKNIELLELYFQKRLNEWVNHSAAYCVFDDIETLDANTYRIDESYFLESTKVGETLLPESFVWIKK